MELEVIFENEFASARYDRDKGVLWASYKGIVKTDLSIESFKNVVDVLNKYPIRGAIYNMMEMKGTFTNINQWLKDVWYPALLPQGYICWTMATTDVFTRLQAICSLIR